MGLAWESAGTDEPGDQNADSAASAHAFWSLGPTRDGNWSVELIERDEDLEEIPGSGVRLPDCSSERKAKALAQQHEDKIDRKEY